MPFVSAYEWLNQKHVDALWKRCSTSQSWKDCSGIPMPTTLYKPPLIMLNLLNASRYVKDDDSIQLASIFFTNSCTSLLNVFDLCYLLYATHLMVNASRAKSIVNHSDQFCIIITIIMTCTPCRWVIWLRIWPCFHHLCNQQHPLELSALFQCSIIIESTPPSIHLYHFSFNHCTISSKKKVYR